VQDFEQLGVFYLGRQYSAQRRACGEGLLLYDSRDLLTHAVCIGMTGSGKTGLCMDIVEEAAIDGIPVIAIDPKGDLANLLLTFPGLTAGEFLPWINEDDARRKGMTSQQFAANEAQVWAAGLAEWGQSGERIALLRRSADFAIFTPGSTAGLPVSILKTLAAPAAAVAADGELLRERVAAVVSSLMVLAGVEADPVKSREHILLSNILAASWKKGQDLTLPTIIEQIQNPPFKQVGALDLESFYPAAERFGLSLLVNNLLAAPGFEAWLTGEPLDVGSLLHTQAGRPRVSIFSIAHLRDAERMFFVTLLLNELVSWMRAQSGTTSLRAVVFMDEIGGFLPPVAAPPSKGPLLSLLKQGRAFGVGVLLASQNPVDLDYKALSNAGTWFVGRLQTERDKLRLLDGLEGVAQAAGGGFDRRQTDSLLSGLTSRVFLMSNAHNRAPELFQTRWTLSYLRGPLTRGEIRKLMDPLRGQAARDSGARPPESGLPAAGARGEPSPVRPVVPPEIPQFFLPPAVPPPGAGALLYRPMILGCASVRFVEPGADLDVWQQASFLAPVPEESRALAWAEAARTKLDPGSLQDSPAAPAVFAPLPSPGAQPGNYKVWAREFAAFVLAGEKLWLLSSELLGVRSRPGETQGQFRARLSQLARERRDQAVEELRARYAGRLAALAERLKKAEQAAELGEQVAREEQIQSALAVGATLLGALVGRRRLSATALEKASSAARGLGRASRKQTEAAQARASMDALQQEMDRLERALQSEVSGIKARFSVESEQLLAVAVTPRKSNVSTRMVALVWAPYVPDAAGNLTPAWPSGTMPPAGSGQ